uniref:F-box domain-containing protein n=1 Tax=viral metagenome TaxID=1070528 RepID=A0A6C0CAB8_9ZZZZ
MLSFPQDITSHILNFLNLDDVRSFALTRTECYKIFAYHIAFDRLVRLNHLRCPIIERVLSDWKFCKLDLSNTMISDQFPIQLLKCNTLILHHCYLITDAFIKKLKSCENLDISYCVNVTGEFIETKKVWKYLKLTGCYFMDPHSLLNLNCEVLDLTDSLLIYDLCENQKYCGDVLKGLQKCKTIYLSRYFDKDGGVYRYDDIVFDALSENIMFVDNFLYITHQDVQNNTQILTKSQNDSLSIGRTPPAAIIVPDDSDIIKPFFYNSISGGFCASKILPQSFRPPGFVSICKNYHYDVEDPTFLINQYLSDREKYIHALISNMTNPNLMKYNFTAYFRNILRSINSLEDKITDRLYFRTYHPTEDGLLGPQYRDCDYITQGNGGATKNYGSIPDSENVIKSLIKLIVTPEISILFDHKSIMTNEEYHLHHNNKYVYVDILATLEEECIFPKQLSKEEYDIAFKVIKDDPMSREEMKEKYATAIIDYNGDPKLICNFDETEPVPQIADYPKKMVVESKASKIIELIMEMIYFVTESTIKTIIIAIIKLLKIYDILMR